MFPRLAIPPIISFIKKERWSNCMEKEMNSYFGDLREQIMNEEKWVEDKFIVFSYEAGSGKSQSTFRFLAEMTKQKSNRVLYVQRFVKDDELDNTVSTINSHAGKRVVEGIHSKMGVREKKKCIDAQVLVISHQMYLQICSGKRQELVKNRDILIIDEYPDLVERITLTINDVCELWGKSIENNHLENLAYLLRKKRYECMSNSKQCKMQYIDFGEKEFELYKRIFSQRSEKIAEIIGEPLLEKLQQILSNGCYFYESAFHTFNNQLKLHTLKNNIILDANGSFDYRYRLSSQFIVKETVKFYDYSTSTLQHFKVKTDKTALKKQINLAEKTFEKISLENKNKTLIVTDKDNTEKVERKVSGYLSQLGFSKEEIDKRVSIDYFGNLIGVNTYRDFETVVVLKTPFFDYLSYALTYLYFQSKDDKKMEDISVFQNADVESIRKTVVGGEIYQAIKRINRDNSQFAQMIVCTDYQEAIDVVVGQLPNIKYESDSVEVNKLKVDELPGNSAIARVAKAEKFLLEQMDAGVEKVQKKILKDLVGVKDGGNFKRTILNNLAPFIKKHEIEITNNWIILTK
jgi:hypothetical protein